MNGEGDINDGLLGRTNSINVAGGRREFEGEIRTGVNGVDIDRALGFDVRDQNNNVNVAEAGQVGQEMKQGLIDNSSAHIELAEGNIK